jgi:hypothetical protein
VSESEGSVHDSAIEVGGGDEEELYDDSIDPGYNSDISSSYPASTTSTSVGITSS